MDVEVVLRRLVLREDGLVEHRARPEVLAGEHDVATEVVPRAEAVERDDSADAVRLRVVDRLSGYASRRSVTALPERAEDVVGMDGLEAPCSDRAGRRLPAQPAQVDEGVVRVGPSRPTRHVVAAIADDRPACGHGRK